jgi:hypothetical protein
MSLQQAITEFRGQSRGLEAHTVHSLCVSVTGHDSLRVRPATPADRELLLGMYQSFDPLGAASAPPWRGPSLQKAEHLGLRRILATAASENIPALRLLKRFCFRASRFTSPVLELELELPAPGGGRAAILADGTAETTPTERS